MIFLFINGKDLQASEKSKLRRSLIRTHSLFLFLPTRIKPYFFKSVIKASCSSNVVTYISSSPLACHCHRVRPIAPSPIRLPLYLSSILIVVIFILAAKGNTLPSCSSIDSISPGFKLMNAPMPWSSSKTRAFFPSPALRLNHSINPVLFSLPG